jgi:hypothetical protein
MKSKIEIGIFLTIVVIVNVSMYNYFTISPTETFTNSVIGNNDASCKCVPEDKSMGIPEAVTLMSNALTKTYNVADKLIPKQPKHKAENHKPKKPKFKSKMPRWLRPILKPITSFLKKIYSVVSKIIIGIIKGILGLIPFKALRDYLKDALKPEGNIVKAIFNLSIGIFKSILLIGVLPWLLFFISLILVFFGMFSVLSGMISFIRFMVSRPKPNLEGDVSKMKNEIEELKASLVQHQ